MSKREEIIEAIKDMDIDEQYYLFCQYCEDADCMDDMPESSDDIDEMWTGCKPSEILEHMDGYDNRWDYYSFDGYGHVQEWEGIEYPSEVADYIIDNDNDLSNDDIRDILDNNEDEEED